MKKQLRKFLCMIMTVLMLLTGMNVQAESGPMKMSWYGDYSDNAAPELIIEFTAPVSYKQQVTAVVYPASVINPALTDYVQVKEVTADGGTTERIILSILNTYTAPDGKYTVALDGSGYMREESVDKITVDVIKPSRIPQILANTDIASVIAEVTPALQLDTETNSTRKIRRINIISSVCREDFGGAFKTLEDIRTSWKISDIIAYIGDAGATAAELRNKLEGNSMDLGIDTNNEDYLKHIDSVCQDILNYHSEYNNGAGVLCIKDLQEIIKQYTGLHEINAATEETIYGVFDTYKSYFGISSEKLAIYNGYQSNNQTEKCDWVLRELYNKNFLKNSELVTAFVCGVNNVQNSGSGNNTPTVIIVPSASGNTSPSTVPGAPSAAPTQPAVTPAAVSFKDVPSSHWAYSFITELAQKKIIGGYDDNTFKPNNNVTREEFVKMIIGASGLVSLDETCEFTDVPETAWFYDYVASAYNAGIILGVEDTVFGVGTNITRQDVAVIASRVLAYLGKTPTATADVTLTDIDAVSDYAQDSVKLLNGMGIINGYDDGTFMPKNTLTRAEAATIICKLINSL